MNIYKYGLRFAGKRSLVREDGEKTKERAQNMSGRRVIIWKKFISENNSPKNMSLTIYIFSYDYNENGTLV
jgi:hypothetical protein